MSGEEGTTRENIHRAGKKEFLEKGFKSASLRNIVKTAGVTTGAFYGYYKSKEALFDALVSEQYFTFMTRYKEAHQTFSELSPIQQFNGMGEISGECMEWMTEYIYEYFDEFKLLLCCAEGTRYEEMIHEMVEIEVSSTHSFISVLNKMGQSVPDIHPQLEHMLISGMFTAYFEMIIHDMPKENAGNYVKELRMFYTAGWCKIMGL